MLNADHLQTFLAVADTGSFTAAATRLGFTQPAVSQQIRALEGQLAGARLFRRAGQHMRLTHVGEELLNHARELVTLAERAERQVLGLQGQVTGRVDFACAPSTGELLLPALLSAFRGSNSRVQFAVEVGPSKRLLPWLAEGVVQLVIVDEHPRRRSLEALPLGREGVVCLAARGHALLGAKPPEMRDLREISLIVPPRGTALRRGIEEQLRRRFGASIALPIALETDSASIAAQAAADGLGLAFVPQHRAPKTRDLGVVNLAGMRLEQHWFLVRGRAGEQGSPVDKLWEFAASPDGRKLLQRVGLKAPHPLAGPSAAVVIEDGGP